jgi:hypothetical protein
MCWGRNIHTQSDDISRPLFLRFISIPFLAVERVALNICSPERPYAMHLYQYRLYSDANCLVALRSSVEWNIGGGGLWLMSDLGRQQFWDILLTPPEVTEENHGSPQFGEWFISRKWGFINSPNTRSVGCVCLMLSFHLCLVFPKCSLLFSAACTFYCHRLYHISCSSVEFIGCVIFESTSRSTSTSTPTVHPRYGISHNCFSVRRRLF